MNILISPDKFKGSLAADQVATAIEQGLAASKINFKSVKIPLADGGDGTAKLLTDFAGGSMPLLNVQDPIGRIIDATYGLVKKDRVAFIEMATASGLALLKSSEQNPLLTSSFGTGQLILDALQQGVDHIILGIGGTATNDGGIGIANALGIMFRSRSGELLAPIGKNLNEIDSIDCRSVNEAIKKIKFTVLCDVLNPLYGPDGAAFIFAPQKGANAAVVRQLDAGLRHFAQLLHREFDVDVNFPGAGAAGGVSATLKTFFHAEIKSGIDFIMEYLQIERQISQADIVITGEGKLDRQTLKGKVISGLAKVCHRHKKPLFVVTAVNELSIQEWTTLGVRDVLVLPNAATDLEWSMKNAAHDILECIKSSAERGIFFQ